MDSDDSGERGHVEWREKLKALKADLDDLKRRAMAIAGLSLEEVERNLKQEPLETYLKQIEVRHLVVHHVEGWRGTPCFIISSDLYPEVGLLAFDSPTASGGPKIKLVGDDRNASFSMACACCSPHLAGIPQYEFGWSPADDDVERDLFMDFEEMILHTCKNHGVTKLVYVGRESMANATDSPLKFAKDGPVIGGFSDLELDRWRFASAFCELMIGDHTHPFGQLFTE